MKTWKKGASKIKNDVLAAHQNSINKFDEINKYDFAEKNIKKYNAHETVDRQVSEVPIYDNVTLGINTEGDIEKLKNFFRGRRLSRDGERFERFEGADEVMNEAGAEYLLSNHQQIMSISNATSFFKDRDEVKPLVEEYAGNISELLCSKYREWAVKVEFFDMIIDNLANSYHLFLLKSVGDKQRSHMSHFKQSQPQDPMKGLNEM